MDIIITHEQADFDALASLLGAHLLNEHFVPILPQRMNRNLQAFLNLYGMAMPFIEYHDLPVEPIENIILVDTQSLISVRGVGPHTHIRVIDHHPERQGLPKTWDVFSDETGANTTIFVEWIEEKGIMLDVLQASLLLLGIYEDTGSLTYSRTSVRDLRAAAYLLENRADLEILGDFLNHPLSLKQEELYNKLQGSAETYTINGHVVVISAGDGRTMDEELSTLAHKLRNSLDPDALIMIISTRGGIQIIGRSSTDRIDVGALASRFGGGGHTLASAALIHEEREIDQIKKEILGILPDYIKPPISVAQIMSTTPHVLSPDTPVVDVATRMQRYGYEGYPIIEAGKVIGLLTRRAVDRAMTHKIDLPARSLMQTGNVTVTPDDSIGHLQSVMIESGWGQIPVINPTTGKIIGIVTRTDLLKILVSKSSAIGKKNFTFLVEKLIPKARLKILHAIAQVAKEERTPLFIVGGFVRDLLLNRSGMDFDLVVEGDAIHLTKALLNRYGGRMTTHPRFGTAKWFLSGTEFGENAEEEQGTKSKNHLALPDALDLISARQEFYTHPTALPSVERGSIKLDLHRRDFTINTMALRLDSDHYGELLDYWGGYIDLNKRVIRVLHSLSFIDDPTRMLRAIRYEQRYHFAIEERTLQLLIEARPLLERVSGDRIRHEIDRILDEDEFILMLSRLFELGLLHTIHENLIWNNDISHYLRNLPGGHPAENWKIPESLGDENRKIFRRWLIYTTWFIHIPCNQVQSVITRLKLPVRLTEIIQTACKLWLDYPQIIVKRPSEITFRLDQVAPIALYTIYLALQDKPQYQKVIIDYITRWRDLFPIINGDGVSQHGIPPGPIYRTLLENLRSAWLDGEIHNAVDENRLLGELLIRYHNSE